MSEMRLNPLTGRWVTIVADRARRPTDFAPGVPTIEDPEHGCPFCPAALENEPTVLERKDPDGAWDMKIIPNRYPAFEGDEGFAVRNRGPVYVNAEGTGMHEVFVFTPEHAQSFDMLSDDAAGEFMITLKQRIDQHAALPNIRYTQAIINHGREAGASLSHPHGQVLGLPFVPGEVLDEERAFGRFAGGCLLCTTIEAELSSDERVVLTNDDAVVVAPYWSGTPYELLIMPRQHDVHLPDTDDAALRGVGVALRDGLKALVDTLGYTAYNVGFHTAPHAHDGEYHWHVHVWPNLATQAGFERGTGVMINVMPPERAAADLGGSSEAGSSDRGPNVNSSGVPAGANV